MEKRLILQLSIILVTFPLHLLPGFSQEPIPIDSGIPGTVLRQGTSP